MARRLYEPLRGRRITSVEVLRGTKYLPGDETKQIQGMKICHVLRRGKYLLFYGSYDWDETGNHGKLALVVIHNAMSGFWDFESDPWTFDYVEGQRESKESDVRVRFMLDDGKVLRFHDARLFGSIRFHLTALTSKCVPALAKLGPDALRTDYSPLISSWDFEDFKTRAKRAKPAVTIKELLMDQTIVAGVGNIYAAEALWESSIDPHRPANSLTDVELHLLYVRVPDVLRWALDRKLSYKELKIYRKRSCLHCKTPISVTKIKERSTYHCPTCQK